MGPGQFTLLHQIKHILSEKKSIGIMTFNQFILIQYCRQPMKSASVYSLQIVNLSLHNYDLQSKSRVLTYSDSALYKRKTKAIVKLSSLLANIQLVKVAYIIDPECFRQKKKHVRDETSTTKHRRPRSLATTDVWRRGERSAFPPSRTNTKVYEDARA